jgi:two-component system OmpR family sensor kinase
MMTAAMTTAAAMTRSAPAIAPAQETDDHGGGGPPSSLLARFSGLRVRILGGYVLVLTVATIASLFVLRTVLINRLDERINHSLAQEVAELQTLAKGSDPETGRPFKGDVRAIFGTFFRRNIASPNEAMLAIVGGKAILQQLSPQGQGPPYDISTDPELLALWRGIDKPKSGSAETPEGEIRYLAVPLMQRGGGTEGIFVVALFRDLEKQVVDSAVRSAAQVSVITLIIGLIGFYALSGRILSRVEAVRSTAQRITESDPNRRLPVEGSDEIAQLAATFNELLDRIEESFATQRNFIDDAGHELRTPITIIRGHLELMGDDPEERRETIALVTDELVRMSRMVEDLLMLTKAERPDFLNLTSVDVRELTDELNTKVRGLAHREWGVDEMGRGLIEADRQRLTQAMIQLSQNAAQHTDDEDRIWIGSKVANGEARFWVRDTGPGISKEEQERIFDRFARAKSRARRSDGMGLGLAIVKAIAEGHHGRVRLLSAPGQGSTFTIIIPVDQPYSEMEDPQP